MVYIYIDMTQGVIEMQDKLACPECGRTNLVKQGIVWSGRTKMQQYHYKGCGRNIVYPIIVNDKERRLKSA